MLCDCIPALGAAGRAPATYGLAAGPADAAQFGRGRGTSRFSFCRSQVVRYTEQGPLAQVIQDGLEARVYGAQLGRLIDCVVGLFVLGAPLPEPQRSHVLKGSARWRLAPGAGLLDYAVHDHSR
jgi:hypothetical protein